MDKPTKPFRITFWKGVFIGMLGCVIIVLGIIVYFCSTQTEAVADALDVGQFIFTAGPSVFKELIPAAFDEQRLNELVLGEFKAIEAQKCQSRHDYKGAHRAYEEYVSYMTRACGPGSFNTFIALDSQVKCEVDTKHYEEAKSICKFALNQYPKDRSVGTMGISMLPFILTRTSMAQILMHDNNNSEAIQILKLNVHLADEWEGSMYHSMHFMRGAALKWLAYAFMEDKQYENAIVTYRKLIADSEKRPSQKSELAQALCGLADAYGWLNTKEADNNSIQLYTRALLLQPDSVDIYRRRGIIFRLLDRFDESLRDLNHAITLAPDDVILYLDRSETYDDMKEPLKAIADIDHGIAIAHADSENNEDLLVRLHRSRANSLVAAKRYKDAIAEYTQQLGHEKSKVMTAWIYNLRADSEQALGEHDLAIGDYTKALNSMELLKQLYNAGDSTGTLTYGQYILERRAESFRATGKTKLANEDIRSASEFAAIHKKLTAERKGKNDSSSARAESQ